MSGLSLREILSSPAAPAHQLASARRALATAWCQPVDDALRASARRVSTVPVSPLDPGEVLLVSVNRQAAREALWSLRWGKPSSGVPFGSRARTALELAWRLGRDAAAHLHDISGHAPPSGASEVFKRGDDADHVLDEESFGLAAALAVGSHLMERPVPASVVASAVLRDDGALAAVHGLERKLRIIAESALAVSLVLTSREQASEAAAIVEREGWPLVIRGVSTVAEAFDVVFPEARESAPPSWVPKEARRLSDSLLAICRGNPSLRDWAPVERAAGWVCEMPGIHASVSTRARFARRIASRHANGDQVSIPWEEFRGSASDCDGVAHVVQAAADAGAEELPEYIRRATEMVGDFTTGTDEGALRLAGAVGRALATLRRYPEARTFLRDATLTWFEVRPSEASFPLSEWLRVSSLDGGTRDDWHDAQAAVDRYRANDPEDQGASFVLFALGRGHVVRGDPTEGLRVLDAASAAAHVEWLRRSIERWRALACVALGDADAAQEIRDAVSSARNERGEVTVEGLFVALDRAIEGEGELGAALRAVRAANVQGVRWLPDDAKTLAREYPY